MSSKYVAGCFKNGCFGAVIIPDTMAHRDVEYLFRELTSAGFVSVGVAGDDMDSRVNVTVYGKSVSLKIESDEKDTWLVRQALGLQD